LGVRGRVPARRRRKLRLFCLALAGAGVLLGVIAQPGALGSTSAARPGGIFRISLAVQATLDHMDPALSYTAPGWALIDTTCARLMAYPDKPPPAGFRVVPEVAAGFPKVSRDLKTFTFTVRNGFRFSDGAPVRASAFARAINRTLDPAIDSPGAMFTRDIVGAADVLAGRRRAATGVVARGNTLVVRFRRAAPDFAALTTLPFFCAVPPTLPADAEGLGPIPAAGPYHVVEYRPGERVVLRRNRFYGGERPHHVDGFDVDLQAASPTEMIQRIERGEADWGHNLAPAFLDPALGLEQKYGINRSQFFLTPGLTLRMFAFNTSRPLFRNNPRLRRAVNYALDRRALQALAGGPLGARLTDQYLPSLVPGFRDAEIYPLDHADLETARDLARGNLRSGRAVFYTPDFPAPLAVAQLAKQQLAEIGLHVEIKRLPLHVATAAYLNQLARRGESWDLALVLWTPNLPNPHAYINLLLDARHIGGTNVAHFASRTLNVEMRRAARLPQARERRRAYGTLDIRLARETAPLAALSVLNESTLVSTRVGCIVLRPQLDLTAVCLKEPR
jgi:peptide/nickel transport system substrate-binding protein